MDAATISSGVFLKFGKDLTKDTTYHVILVFSSALSEAGTNSMLGLRTVSATENMSVLDSNHIFSSWVVSATAHGITLEVEQNEEISVMNPQDIIDVNITLSNFPVDEVLKAPFQITYTFDNSDYELSSQCNFEEMTNVVEGSTDVITLVKDTDFECSINGSVVEIHVLTTDIAFTDANDFLRFSIRVTAPYYVSAAVGITAYVENMYSTNAWAFASATGLALTKWSATSNDPISAKMAWGVDYDSSSDSTWGFYTGCTTKTPVVNSG